MQKTKHLKIFISSTFEDMQQEREVLLKEVFLELKQIAKKRDVEITEIDLRWGITAKQAENGHTVKVCLDEIQRCKDSPIFFLGMLGHRYGWSGWSEKTHIKILENKKYEWIKDYIGKSITELEISSVIRRDKNHNRAFIYFKEDKKVDEDIRLIDLKKDIKKLSKTNKRLFVDDYKNINEFKKKVLKDFKNALDKLYPPTKVDSEIERLRYNHSLFAKSRTKLYIPNAKNEKILDDFLKSDSDKLLLYGESGLGKSALVANYFDKYKKKSDTFVIEHYIGGAGELSNNLYQIIRRIMLEIKDRFLISEDIPNEQDKLLSDFAMWLGFVKEPTIIILDGYNQIEDKEKRKLFAFLPKKIKNVKLIITSIKSDYDISNKQQINPLTINEQKALIERYFDTFGKYLTTEIVDKILSNPLTKNTLFLKTLLNEIRLVGKYETLQQEIEKYLKANSIIELFELIFARFEKDYKNELSKNILTLIYASRDGLSEDNLLEIINQNSKGPITRLDFSPAFLAILEHLINQNGYYKFFHSYIEEAVKKRYLTNNNLLKEKRREIANYFKDKKTDNQKARELPYQLYELKDKQGLYDVLVDVEFFVIVNKLDAYELLQYLKLLNRDFFYSLKNNLLKLPEDNILKYIDKISYFLSEIYTNYELSLELNLYSLKLKNKYINKVSSNSIAKSYDNLGLVYYLLGNEKSIENFKKSIEIKKGMRNKDYLEIADTYINLGLCYEHFEKYDKALFYYQEAKKILENKLYKLDLRLGELYNNLAELYRLLKMYKKSEEYNKKNYSILNYHFPRYHHFIAIYYNNMGLLYKDKKNYKKSFIFFKKALSIYLVVIGKEHPDTMRCLANIAHILELLNETKLSIKYDKLSLKLRKKYLPSDYFEIGISYNNLASTYRKIKLLEKSKLFYHKAIQIYKKNENSNLKYLKQTKKNLKEVKRNSKMIYKFNPKT